MKEYSLYDDKELANLLAQNDQLAFTELYNRFWKKLFAVAYNRLHETTAAEDIVHDVFASLWANRNKIQITFLENYLATAVKYMVLGKLKKKAMERSYSQIEYTGEVVEMPVENALHYKRILEIVQQEVNNLPEKCRLVFVSSRNRGMSVKQIASELNISPKTVENHINKAVRKLKLATRAFLNSLFFIVAFSSL